MQIATGVPRSISRTAGLHMLDGQLWGGADDYKVRFDGDGFEFTPALGRAAPRNYPLTFRLVAIGRGSVLAPSSRCEPTFHDHCVQYDRGVATERYDVGIDGIEQSFVFHSRPEGSGDLVVRGRLTTGLVVTPEAEGLRFTLPGVGGFRMGAVVGIDADGVRAQGSVRYAAGVLELSLPAGFVEHAALPFTLDPPIGGSFRITQTPGPDDQSPYAAFDATNDAFLVIWTRIFSATDIDVHGQLLTRAGGPILGRLAIENSVGFEYEPQVASCDGRNAFVVVYTRDGDIIGRTVNPVTGAVSASAVIAGGVGSFQHFGTVSTALGNSHVVCAWQSDGDVALQATRVVVGTGLTLSVPGPVHTFATTAMLSGPAVRPRMSKSDHGTGRHAIAFQRDFSAGANSDAKIIIVDGTGMPIVAEGGSLDATLVDDELPEVDGDGTNWVVAWQRLFAANDHDIVAMSVSFDPGTGQRSSNTPVVVIEAGRNNDEGIPSVTWTGDSCLVGWSDQVIPNTANWAAKVMSVDQFLCTSCEGTFALSSPFVLNGPAFGCSVASGGGGGEDTLLVWESSDTVGFNGDIVVQRWRTLDGAVTSLGGGCGSGGTHRATCARSPNAGFRFRLRDATPGAPTLFVLSAGRLDLPCGPCSLVPDPNGGILLALNTGIGDQTLPVPIPAASPLVGVPLFTQWATVDLSAPACPLFNLEMSNALRVVIE